METPHKCLVCGETTKLYRAESEQFSVHCDSCHANGPTCEDADGAVSEYNRDCETIVSRVLAEALKDAPRVEARADGSTTFGDIEPGSYALIPVKEAKP